MPLQTLWWDIHQEYCKSNRYRVLRSHEKCLLKNQRLSYQIFIKYSTDYSRILPEILMYDKGGKGESLATVLIM